MLKGDSGSPLVCYSEMKPKIYGVASGRAETPCSSDQFGGFGWFAPIKEHVNWIKDVIRNESRVFSNETDGANIVTGKESWIHLIVNLIIWIGFILVIW